MKTSLVPRLLLSGLLLSGFILLQSTEPATVQFQMFKKALP